jgi:hypothetical protein
LIEKKQVRRRVDLFLLSANADSATPQGLVSGVEYFWNVSAYAADVTGWTTEVTTSDVKAFIAP